MIRAWRLTKPKYAASAFDGEGARLFGGRWNSPGTAVVYTSSSAALALTELLVHLDSAALLSAHVLIPVEMDEALIETLDAAQLPRGWVDFPVPADVQAFGDHWVRERRSAVLRVPSVVVPMENNFLLNPAHPEFGKLQMGRPIKFPIDPRLRGR